MRFQRYCSCFYKMLIASLYKIIWTIIYCSNFNKDNLLSIINLISSIFIGIVTAVITGYLCMRMVQITWHNFMFTLPEAEPSSRGAIFYFLQTLISSFHVLLLIFASFSFIIVAVSLIVYNLFFCVFVLFVPLCFCGI